MMGLSLIESPFVWIGVGMFILHVKGKKTFKWYWLCLPWAIQIWLSWVVQSQIIDAAKAVGGL